MTETTTQTKPAKCEVCGKPLGRTVPKTYSKRARANLLAMLFSDPFCSAVCARKSHGILIQGEEPQKAPSADLEWVT